MNLWLEKLQLCQNQSKNSAPSLKVAFSSLSDQTCLNCNFPVKNCHTKSTNIKVLENFRLDLSPSPPQQEVGISPTKEAGPGYNQILPNSVCFQSYFCFSNCSIRIRGLQRRDQESDRVRVCEVSESLIKKVVV